MNVKTLEPSVCIYPAYLNKNKTVAEGRRIPKEKSCENPLCKEIKDVCEAAGFKTLAEDSKVYPREVYKFDATYRGRVRVQLKSEDGSPVNDRFINKRALLLYIAEMIPKLKSRIHKCGVSGSSTQAQQGPSAQKKDKKSKKKKNRR